MKNRRKKKLIWFILIFILIFGFNIKTLLAKSELNKKGKKVLPGLPLFDINFIDENTGYSVGYFGEIWNTQDGGKTWTMQNSGIEKAIFRIQFINKMIGFAVGGEGTILCTKDGGKTWLKQESTTKNQLFDLCFLNERKGFVVGEFGTIIHTEDGGKNWINISTGQDIILNGIDFATDDVGVAVGEFGNILYTQDGGKTWLKVMGGEKVLEITELAEALPTLNSVSFLDSNFGVAVGIGGYLLRTENGGKTWEQAANEIKNHLFRVKAEDDVFCAVGLYGTVIESTDKGKTWNFIGPGGDLSFSWYYGIEILGGKIYLSGENGRIIKKEKRYSSEWKILK